MHVESVMRGLAWGGAAAAIAVAVVVLARTVERQRFDGERRQRWAVCYAAGLAWHEQHKPDWSPLKQQAAASTLCDGQVPLRGR